MTKLRVIATSYPDCFSPDFSDFINDPANVPAADRLYYRETLQFKAARLEEGQLIYLLLVLEVEHNFFCIVYSKPLYRDPSLTACRTSGSIQRAHCWLCGPWIFPVLT